jgi:putative membrane protein
VKLIIDWLINAAALYVATRLVPGVSVADTGTLLIAAVAIGLINSIVRPIAAIVTFPITVLTLGLFYFVLNGAMLYLAAALTPGFELAGPVTAVIAAVVVSIVATVLHLFIEPKKKRRK